MLLTKTVAAPALPPVTGIFTIVSLPVLATNSALPALLKPSPLAPNGGTPAVVSSGSCFQTVATPPPGPVFQMMPLKESET